MGTFDYRFADLVQQFTWRRGQPVPPKPGDSIIIFRPRPEKYAAPGSKFAMLTAFMPSVRSHFPPLPAPKVKPEPTVVQIIATVPASEAFAIVAPAPMNENIPKPIHAEITTVEEPKQRKT